MKKRFGQMMRRLIVAEEMRKGFCDQKEGWRMKTSTKCVTWLSHVFCTIFPLYLPWLRTLNSLILHDEKDVHHLRERLENNL